MEAKETTEAAAVLSLIVQPEYVHRFICFFTEGVTLPITTGGTLKETVCEQLGVDAEYFETRIQTIFLNFKAVDRPETARVKDGAIIALSAAMPGLVGATMRRGGNYAALRSSISYAETGGNIVERRGWITLKLLNMVARELGPQFLANGVYVMDEKVAAFFKTRVTEFNNERCEVTLNGKPVAWEQVIAMKLSGKKVHFKVSV